MKDKFDRHLYGKRWKIIHFAISIIICVFIIVFMKICQIPLCRLFLVINDSTISLSAAISGFVFAGMSIFISMDGNKKMATVKAVGKDNIIYNILITSIFSFVISLLLMFIDTNILIFNETKIILIQTIIKLVVETLSIYSFLLGFIFFFQALN